MFFLNYWFWKSGHVTTEHMEMPGIAVRIECKHFRIPAGPASGRNSPLKSRNLCFADYDTFFQSLGKFEKWGNRKFLLAMWSTVFLSGWKRFGVNRWPGGCAMSGNGARPGRKPRVLTISLAGHPIFDLAFFGLYGPRICTAQRGTMILGDNKTLGYSGTLRGIPAVS